MTIYFAPAFRFPSWKNHPKEFGNLRTIVHENPVSVATVMRGLFVDIVCRMSHESVCVVEYEIRGVDLMPDNSSIKVNGWVIGFPREQYPAPSDIENWDIVAYVSPQDFEHTTYLFLLLSRIITVIANYPKTAKYHVSSTWRETVPSRIPTAEDQKYMIPLLAAPMGRAQCTDLPTYSMMRVKTLARSLHIDLLRLYGLNEREIRKTMRNNPFTTYYCTIENGIYTEEDAIRASMKSVKSDSVKTTSSKADRIKTEYTKIEHRESEHREHREPVKVEHRETHFATESITTHSSSHVSPSPAPPPPPPPAQSRRRLSPFSLRH